MKIFVFFVTLSFTVTSMATARVLVEATRNVGFAPPPFQGTFRTQILSNGTIRSVNNKNKTTTIAKLSKAALEKLTAKIENTSQGEMVGEDGPMCTDAPSYRNTAYKADGTELSLKTEIGCIEKIMAGGQDINQAIEAADNLSDILK